ncbi:MAG TPA: BadF/BadG/BcrA/BcrD ATPase family protein [Anaeromyxobacter sp.]|nr:BadF/BadG/BcrA/BcrD ATPase family protein [Anaeromyxobacter sp.]
MTRFLGVDAGAETVKVVELEDRPGGLVWLRRARLEHHKAPGPAVRELVREWGWDGIGGALATGRLGRQLALERIPGKRARIAGHRFLFGPRRAVIVDIGAHGFSVLELGDGDDAGYRENPRCSQGTGNFLRQLVERFGLAPEEADVLAAPVEHPAPLSGRCPVILKTDMTHLANQGEDRARILAGLFDAICDNVQVLLRSHPGAVPPAVLLAGGVGRSRRIRERFGRRLAERGMTLAEERGDDALFLDALGCAVLAARGSAPLPAPDDLVSPPAHAPVELRPPLSHALSRVRRLPPRPPPEVSAGDALLLGLDIGSTGSKAVALHAPSGAPIWESYTRTAGDPVAAAQELVRRAAAEPAGRAIVGVGVTGSGREIVGSLLATCYGGERVHVLNEIAAHAEGARACDPRVDTIFEIGGQDAKYIRLAAGRVVDAAMNEACSAGTGSFIEEQGLRLGNLDVEELARVALGADACAALGQHCAVFMAEILDEAAAAGVTRPRLVAGLYDSVVQNYLNRVKGSRSVGEVVFCQGMPFSADALAAAVARQTGAEVIVPPNPGTVGACGIALLAREALPGGAPLDLARFLDARVERKDTFVCRSTAGCGGSGNACRIDRLRTRVRGERRAFSWGGGCSIHDRGTRTRKLPDGAPDPFRERTELVESVLRPLLEPTGAPRVALAEAFQLKGLFPFFARFFRALDFDLVVTRGGGREALRRGTEAANIQFCAPMQQYRGLVAAMAATPAELLFLPMLRDLPPVKDEPSHWLCPIVAGSADVVRLDLHGLLQGRRVLSPAIQVGPGFLDAPVFLEACRALAADLGIRDEPAWRSAHAAAREEQARFDAALVQLGRSALDRCRAEGLLPVVVLGRTYTIHDPVLSANIPALLREQGAVAIPVDCYPADPETPLVPGAFWGYTQRVLRAAYEVRRAPGIYSLFASNYGCGPDSFTLHAYARLMEGKPFAVIETDGHAGDAGTKTRVEAFLHCVREDLRSAGSAAAPAAPLLALASQSLPEIARRGSRVLVPPMGPEAEALASALRGYGVPAEVLPTASPEAIRQARRHTSGKECLPMIVTLGSLLQRLERADPREALSFFMPGSNGPCRFGYYRQLHQMILERLGHGARIGIWSPPDSDYFVGVPPGFGAIVFAGLTAFGLLEDALRDVRPVEREPGAAARVHAAHTAELSALLERAAAGDLSARRVLIEAATGRSYGVTALLGRAARALRALKDPRPHPTVMLVGEIYVRSDPGSNGHVADALEARGIRVRLEPVAEYLEYSDHVQVRRGLRGAPQDRLKAWVRGRILGTCRNTVAQALKWPRPARLEEALAAAAPYVREDLEHEAVLAVGLPILQWRRGEIDGAVCVGPLECMPDKVAEAQLLHAREREGLLSMTLSLNGDPVDPEILDGFAYEVKERFRSRA